MSTQEEIDTVPPLVPEEGSQQKRPDNSLDMLLGWLALTIAMVGGGKTLVEYLLFGTLPTNYELLAVGVTLILTYVLGWAITLNSIHRYHNLIMPIVVRVYAWLVVVLILITYGRAIYKMYFELDINYRIYTQVLFGAYLVLVSLYLLEEDYQLRHFAKPIILMMAGQLYLMVIHYVFVKSDEPELVLGDLYFLALMMVIIVLMLQKWLYRPFQLMILRKFPLI